MGLGLLLVLLATALAPQLAAQATAAPSAAVPRIVAIGDLHGDFVAWRAIAQAAQLIDAKGRWTGGTTVLVQAGDVVDRGPDSLRIIDDLRRLQRQAPDSGGRVVMLVGNHEAMMMTGDLRYVSAGEFAAFADNKSQRRRTQAYERNIEAIEAFYRRTKPEMTSEAMKQAWIATMPLGKIELLAAWDARGDIGKWMLGNPAVLLLDGNLFVHAGLGAAYANRTLADINASVSAALVARDTAENSIINDPAGPLWYRGLARGAGALSAAPTEDAATSAGAATAPMTAPTVPPLTVAAELDLVLRATGARRMVIAHTPILSGPAILHDGRLVRIDTGISAAYGGKLSYLEIVDGTPIAHIVPRPAGDVAAPGAVK
ncbi:MAG: metallophosphoesterase [Polymorphobacter sp.]